MLAIAVRYLTGRVYASRVDDRSRVEWPPHPDRLFSALVAALYAGDLVDRGGRDVLLWLERQAPPSLSYPSLVGERTIECYVPVNDPENDRLGPAGFLPELRRREPRRFVSGALGGDPTVYFIWREACPDKNQRELLSKLAARIGYLGASPSLVAVFLADDPPPPVLVPDDSGPEALRVPCPGRLNDLEGWFRRGLRPVPGSWQRYRYATTRRASPRSVFEDMVSVSFSGVYLPIEASLTLTSALRRAVIARIPDPVPPEVHGHTKELHCAFIPLPYVGLPYADGRIMGAAVLLPSGISGSVRTKVLSALSSMHKLRLTNRICLDVNPGLLTLRSYTLQPRRWRGPASEWATVTPVIFGRFPKRRRETVEEIIGVSCEQIGLPRPTEVSSCSSPVLSGVPPARRFRAKRRTDDPERYVSHVKVRFSEPVYGPVVLGSGRYFGMGLCAPVDALAGAGS